MEIHPVDGNSTRGWLDFPPSAPKMDGWKSNHPWAKARPENFKKLYGPLMQSSQNGVYLGGVGVKLPLFFSSFFFFGGGLSNLLNNSHCESGSWLPFTHIFILKVKVYCCHSLQFRSLFSVQMGNSLEQYCASIGLNNFESDITQGTTFPSWWWWVTILLTLN